jgi:hypothetical protein
MRVVNFFSTFVQEAPQHPQTREPKQI